MAYAEKRGKGPRPWRIKYKIPGGEASESGFETKQSALDWGRDQEAKVRAGTWTDPSAGEIKVDQWIDRWLPTQDLGVSTQANRAYLLRRFIRPYWGKRPLNSLTSEQITTWEQKLPEAKKVSRSTASDARSLLHTILGDAASAEPPLIPFNPAVRPRNRGRRILRLDGAIVAHNVDDTECPGTGQPPAEDTPLASWLPVKPGLTPHGLRHSHKTWMIEDGTPEILAEQRLGHQVPGMRGLYSHVSRPMRDTLIAALQARWEQSLADRAALNPHSPVPLLDDLLAPARDRLSPSHLALVEEADLEWPAGENPISQISPNTGTAPIRRVG